MIVARLGASGEPRGALPSFPPEACDNPLRNDPSAMPSSHKKVIVRRFSGDLLSGYLPASGFLHEGCLDLLGLDGRRLALPLGEVRTVSFVRDFTLGDMTSPERLPRRSPSGRPRGDGLWLRLTFRQDGDDLEGLAPADLSLLDDLLRDHGISLAPSDTRGNTQRIFVPHTAIAELRLLGVITSAAHKRRSLAQGAVGSSPAAPAELAQQTLFRSPASASPSGAAENGSDDAI